MSTVNTNLKNKGECEMLHLLLQQAQHNQGSMLEQYIFNYASRCPSVRETFFVFVEVH